VGFLVIKFGMQFVTNYSLNLNKNASVNTTQSDNPTFVAPPVLNPIPDATNSAEIKVSGYALANEQIALYVNDNKVDEQPVKDDKTFSFSHVTLKTGQNSIKAKAVVDDQHESNYTDTQTVTFNNKAPSLSIDSPSDGQTIKGDSHVTVSGKTDPGRQVTINDFWAIVDDQGKFSYNASIQKGDNTIKVVAKDDAGNTTSKEIKVHMDE
jgi:bacillopeptidase F